MQIFGFETVDSLPALYLEEGDLLVLSDLHLGMEKTMTFRGNYIPRHQLERIKQDIDKAREETGALRILINGDLKNEFKTSHAETEEVEELLKFLKKDFEDIIVVKGNHDTAVEHLKTDKVKFKDFHMEEDRLFIHGHESLDIDAEYNTVILGHEHPALSLKDDVGVKEKIDCFLYGETDELNIIVLPAFSSISNGTSINETPQSKLLSPILREEVDKDNLKAIGVSREAGLLEFPHLKHL